MGAFSIAPEPERMERAAPTRPEAAALKGLKSFFFQIVRAQAAAQEKAAKVEAEAQAKKEKAAAKEEHFEFSAFEMFCAQHSIGLRNVQGTFALLDVSKVGHVTLDEWLYMLTSSYMAVAAKAEKGDASLEAEAVCKEVLLKLDGKQRPIHEQDGVSSGVSAYEYALASLCPCYACWVFSTEVSRGPQGVEGVLDYVGKCKDDVTVVAYDWSVNNYHNEYETKRETKSEWVDVMDNEGNYSHKVKQTWEEEVTITKKINTGSFATSGKLQCVDTSAPFTPDTSRRVVQLTSKVEFEWDAKVKSAFDSARAAYYASRKGDEYSECNETIGRETVKHVDKQEVQWLEKDQPPTCCDVECCRCCCVLTWVGAPLWLWYMDGQKGRQQVVFTKRFTGFTAPDITDAAALGIEAAGDGAGEFA